jgi:hypothetical protein
MAIKPSPRFVLFLLFLHVAAAITVYATAVPAAVKLAVILLIALSLIYYLARDVFLFLPDSWCQISLAQNNVSIVVRDGSSFIARVKNTTIVSPYCVVLQVRVEGHRRLATRIFFPDGLGAGEFRELCVRLKFA